MNGSGSMFFGGGLMWIFWLILIVVVIAAFKALNGSNARQNDTNSESPMSILEKRYARGEINREEYLGKKRELEK